MQNLIGLSFIFFCKILFDRGKKEDKEDIFYLLHKRKKELFIISK